MPANRKPDAEYLHVQLNADDRELLAELRKRTGITSPSQLTRLAFRALKRSIAAEPSANGAG